MNEVMNASTDGTSWMRSRRAAVLAQHLVDLAAHAQVGRVEVGLDPGPERAEGVVALAARPLPVALLLVAGGDVVGGRVAPARASARSPAVRSRARLADDDRELALVVDAADAGAAARTGSPGPTTDVAGLRNTVGAAVGRPPVSPPISATWSA